MDPPSNNAAPDISAPVLGGPQSKATILRATFRYAVPIVFIATVVGACSGIIPPWPAATVLLIGLLATIWLVLAKRPGMGAISATAAILVSAWLLRPALDIRAAESNDPIYERYFGIDSSDDKTGDIKIRNIVIATGAFTLNTWMTASLYHVEAGQKQELNSLTVGRSSNRIGEPHWLDMRITLALGDRNAPEGHVTQIGSAGHHRGGGRSGEAVHDVLPHATKTLPGRFTSCTKCIVYVEGDKGFNADRTMTVDSFARENKGSYLVVEVELN